ncbi:ABC multidrug transporter Mdr1 [Ophiocordyceps camponoti-floridani]|uniref:ABC multidrug transporter Mdr1 n=1 Tax=Ophiocordyceps camponoti-floridani TaxID=2030778 RepID=A0A8H4Q1I5_9HYPO|nr:ABC multidrug transporter Mdr1 [Ophiocordyceps camponoti-floridani]
MAEERHDNALEGIVVIPGVVDSGIPTMMDSSMAISDDVSDATGITPINRVPSRNDDEKAKNTRAATSVRPTSSTSAVSEDPFRHLPSHEAEVLRLQVATPDLARGVKAIYRYSSRNDLIIMAVSTFCAVASGAAQPIMTVIFGGLQKTFQTYFFPPPDRPAMTFDEYSHELSKNVLYFVYLAIAEFFSTLICTVGFIYTGEHISAKIREHYLDSCLRQNMAFFDKVGAGEITTRITADTNLIQEGISEKVSLTVAAVATFVTAFVIGFINSWKLTLILSSVVFALIFNVSAWSRFMIKNNKSSLEAYAMGGNLADEVISSIRNAIAFGTQDRLARQYDRHLARAEKFGFRLKVGLAFLVAGMMLVLYLGYGLGYWQGSKFLVDGELTLNKLLTVQMAVMIGAFNLGNVTPNAQAFTTAVAAASKIFNTIDRVSPIDPADEGGDRLESLKGNISLVGVKHIYPSRPEVVVMDGVSLDVPAGKTTALVGASGSGKSTIVGLVERFYNPVQGAVFLDGVDITKLNLGWLRRQMALVSQEPVLFGTTIMHNIRHGLIGTDLEAESEERQRDLVVEAAVKANAHDFISALPEGYETNVGQRGFLLSGGQKQRIAIARAIVSDPKILLLDEATSALDTKSEGVVQAALEAASEGRTTITIAHRLSTIKDAHNIVVMAEGRIVEQGTHDELLEKKTAYYNLVSAQHIAPTAKSDEADEEKKHDEDEEDEEDDDVVLIRRLSTLRDTLGVGLDEPKLKRTLTQSSASSRALRSRPAEVRQKYSLLTLIKLIMSFNGPEWRFMLIGLFFCVICGGGNPTSAVFFAKQISTLSKPLTDENRHQVKKDSDFWSAMYLMLAWVQFFAFAGQGILFAKGSERLVRRVRDKAFRTMLRQDVSFFDKDENTTGALTSFLSTETTHVAGLSGATLGTLMMMMTTLIVAIVLSLSIGWKLSLVCISTIPVLLSCGFLRFFMLAHFQRRSKRAYAESATFASEAVSAIRTVASLTREQDVLGLYQRALADQQRRSLPAVVRSSALYASSQSFLFLCLALGFWYGGRLIGKHEYTMFQFFLCFMSIVFGAQSAGSIFSFAPDMGKAHHAAGELKTLLDLRPAVDSWSDEGERLKGVEGDIEFRDVHFRYPTRPEQPVLRGLNLTIRPGQYVALVGASGCGKSTTIALLERFYDPLAGSVLVDGRDVSLLNVNDYRSHLALVSQEPTLYQGSIRDNIALGSATETVTDEALEAACREANIYDFVQSLPEGFDTVVGNKGTLLSGGQKQRIAIARALIRDPRILLLDEATSALDSESEHVVQAALDKAAKGRTTIAVAHRLSTIQKADVIYVFDQGRIVESGTHAELMKRGGRYAELVSLQSLERNG